MHLYIIAGRICVDVPDVGLVEGCRPSVGGYCPSTVDFEPAIWFKVMVLDAVTIDCDEHRLSWIPLCDSAISNFAALDSGIALCGSYRLSGSGNNHQFIGCTDDSVYNRLGECFENVPDLMARYEGKQMERDKFNEEVMQLLHVHILPSIRLTTQDRDCIVTCIHSLELTIEQIDQDILQVAEKIGLVEQSLSNLRQKLLLQLMSMNKKESHSLVFSPEFIDLLLQSKTGIEKDIAIAWEKVEHAQTTVDKLRDSPSVDEVALENQRAKRDKVTKEYEKLLLFREKLKEMKRKKHGGILKRVRDAISSIQEDPQPVIYNGMILKLDEFEKLSQVITHKKLLVTSVKEAARLAEKEIEAGTDTFGMEVDCVGAAHSTDVLGGNVTPSWQSLTEQIAAQLARSDGRIAKLHEDFCRRVVDVCSATAVEKQWCHASAKALQRNSVRSATLRLEARDSGTQSSSSGSISEFEIDLNGSLCEPTDRASAAEEDVNQDLSSLSLRSSELQSDTLVRSLPMLPQLDTNNGTVRSTRSVSTHSSASTSVRHRKSKTPSFKASKSATLAPSFRSYVGPGLVSLSERDHGAESPVIIIDPTIDCVQKSLESLRKEIMEHFEQMSTELQRELAALSGKSQYQQIWLDYESHFYKDMMLPLLDLYRLQYANITEAFCSSLPSLIPSDLSLDEAFLIHLLQDDNEQSGYSTSNNNSYVGVKCQNYDNSAASASSDTKNQAADAVISGPTSSDMLEDDITTEDFSRLLRTHSEERRRPRLRTVRISLPVVAPLHSPTATVLVYERTLAPLLSESNLLRSDNQHSMSATTMKLKRCYRQQFAAALECISLAVEARTPGSKLRLLTDCLRETTRQLSVFYADLYGESSSQSSCDELLDAIVILLCNVDGEQMARLYCQLALLADMMAPWLVRGPYSFTLVQFTGACQFIQERLVLKRNRHISKTACTSV